LFLFLKWLNAISLIKDEEIFAPNFLFM